MWIVSLKSEKFNLTNATEQMLNAAPGATSFTTSTVVVHEHYNISDDSILSTVTTYYLPTSTIV